MLSLNTAILRGVAIDLPPVDEQKSIGKVVFDLNVELGVLERRLVKAKALKQGLMQELVTGRTRLPATEAAA